MRKESIKEMIDKNIRQAYIDGSNSALIIDSLNVKMRNLAKVLNDMNPHVNLSEMMNVDWDNIESVRTKYTVFYIQHSTKRIDDLKWIDEKKSKFRKFSNSEIFNLIKLKEKLSI